MKRILQGSPLFLKDATHSGALIESANYPQEIVSQEIVSQEIVSQEIVSRALCYGGSAFYTVQHFYELRVFDMHSLYVTGFALQKR